jgi:hypothetical protein
MTAPGNSLLQILLALAFVIASGYASGRIHQWYKHGLERDRSYREGYDHASRSMFDMAVRTRSTVNAPAAQPTPAEPCTAPITARIGPVGASRRRILARAAHHTGDLRRPHSA